jgi:hypothetical protein
MANVADPLARGSGAKNQGDLEAKPLYFSQMDDSLENLLDGAGLRRQFRESGSADALGDMRASESSIEDLRQYVVRNQPVVVRGALTDWPPVLLWDDAYLLDAGAGVSVPVRHADGALGSCGTPARAGIYRVEEVEWGLLLESLRTAEQLQSPAPLYAAQLRLRTLLPALFRDTRPPPVWLAALGPPWRNAPSAYFGCGSRTPIHCDMLENLLCVVRGRKHIKLWHPSHGTQLYPGGGGEALFSRVSFERLDDPDFPGFRAAAQLAHDVELSAADALYLPCGWWHAVSTPPGERSISVSFWAQQPEGKACAPVERDLVGSGMEEVEACFHVDWQADACIHR